jgi:hypothetical protein
MLIKSYMNQLCGEAPTDLRMGIPAPTTNFVGMSVTLNGTQRKAAINALIQFRQDVRKLEDGLEMQPQRFLMLGINPDTYKVIVWYASQFSGFLKTWWLNRKTRAAIPDTFDSVITKIRKMSLLPNI